MRMLCMQYFQRIRFPIVIPLVNDELPRNDFIEEI